MRDKQVSGGSKNVLFVDDDVTARYLVAEILSSAGYDVETATGGESGLEAFEAGHFDIVITDLVMPEPDGLEVLQAIKRKSPHTPVIVLSGLGGFDDVKRALKIGAYDYISKEHEGIDRVTLCSAVDRAFENLRLIRENADYQKELEAKVAERTRELQNALRDLKEFQRERGDRQWLKFLDVERSEKKFRTLLQKVPNGIATLDSNLHITDYNEAFVHTLELDFADSVTSASVESNPFFLQSAFPEKIRYCISESAEISGTAEYCGPKDETRYIEYTLTPISLDEHDFKVEVLFTIRDVTLEVLEKNRLQKEADHDDLTGLLKHGKFHDMLEQTLENVRASRGTLALIHIDIDNFSDFNTDHGHPIASEMLRIIGARIEASISSRRDFGFRTGGDEFAVILTGFSSDTLPIVVERLLNKLKELYNISYGDDLTMLKCTFSVGVAEYSVERNQTATEIYQEADKATFQAKDAGRNQIVYFDYSGTDHGS